MTLTREEQNRIDDLAASFFERSGDIRAASIAIREVILDRLASRQSAASRQFETDRENQAVGPDYTEAA